MHNLTGQRLHLDFQSEWFSLGFQNIILLIINDLLSSLGLPVVPSVGVRSQGQINAQMQ